MDLSPGIHLLHKPVGPTSFAFMQACVESASGRSAKQRPGRPRVCHGGTLDPFACGLLLILVEPATRLFDYLHVVPKTYHATVRWGIETDNGDLLGRPTFTGDPSEISPQQLDDAMATFVGWRDQIPPATSAKRIGGERAYLKAHRGETVVMPPSRVYLHQARWLRHDGWVPDGSAQDRPRQSQLLLTVGGGYYVRALARDLGRLLGCGAHLIRLHRTAIGPWVDPGPNRSVELRGRDLLPWLPSRFLSDQEVGDLRQDRTIPAGELIAADWPLPPGFPVHELYVRGFHLGRFVFLLRSEDGRLRVGVVLHEGL